MSNDPTGVYSPAMFCTTCSKRRYDILPDGHAAKVGSKWESIYHCPHCNKGTEVICQEVEGCEIQREQFIDILQDEARNLRGQTAALRAMIALLLRRLNNEVFVDDQELQAIANSEFRLERQEDPSRIGSTLRLVEHPAKGEPHG